MKKLMLMLMSLSLLTGRVLEYEYRFPQAEPLREKNFFHLDIPGCMQGGIDGEPLLPKYPVMLLLPPGETLESAELIVHRESEYPLMLPLMPKQADRPYSEGRSGKFIMDRSVYRQKEYAAPGIRYAVQRYRGAEIVMGRISPVTYFPASGMARQTEHATLRIRTKPAASESSLNTKDAALLENLLQNPRELSSYQIDPDKREHLLIVTSPEFSAAFDTLTEFYKAYGIESQIMTTGGIELEEYPGRDFPEKIRNAIRQTYLEKGLDYVLIGGNSSIVPHRGLSCSVNSGGTIYSSDNIPADLYYAALDGDWDNNGNNIFGEYNDSTGYDEADLLPELAVGRMPAANIFELQNLIAKSMRYQAEPVVDELDKHIFFGEFLYDEPESWGADYLELLIGKRSDNGYTTQGIPPHIRIAKWYDQDSTDIWSRETVVDELKKGQSFVHHDGHANTNYLMKFSTSDIDVYDFAIVNGVDHVNPLIYTHGCNCGGFDYANCIGSRLVNDPGIAVGGVFNSRFGWFNEGSTEGPSLHLHREFMNALYGLNIHALGQAHSVSKIATAPWVTAPDQHEQNALRWTYYTINILGDPVMRIYGDKPRKARMNYDLTSIDEAIISATVQVGGTPLEDAGIAALDRDRNILAYGRTDAAGGLELRLPSIPNNGDSLYFSLRAADILPADTLIKVLESAAASPVPKAFSLEAYPNPFNPETTLRYRIPQDGMTRIRLIDLNGRFVQDIYQGHSSAGDHEIVFRAAHLPAGIYLCVLQNDHKQIVRKLLLIK